VSWSDTEKNQLRRENEVLRRLCQQAMTSEGASLQAQLEAAQAEVSQWKAQANRYGISSAESFAEKQQAERRLSDALNENANLKEENEALKRGEAGELLAKAQEEALGWKDMFERCSESFRKYREAVESQELYKAQRRLIHSLMDELEAAKKVADAAAAIYITSRASYRVYKIDGGETDAGNILDLAEHEAQAAFDDAVREYRKLKEAA